MGTTSKILIQEEATALFSLMKQYQPSRQRTRVQALYLLKSGKAASITHASWAIAVKPCNVDCISINAKVYKDCWRFATVVVAPQGFRTGHKPSSRLD